MESRPAFAAAVTMTDFFSSSLVKTVVWGAGWEGQNEVYRKESDSGGIQVKPTFKEWFFDRLKRELMVGHGWLFVGG